MKCVVDGGPLVLAGSVEAGDVVVDMGGASVRGAAFDRVAAALRGAWGRGAALSLGVYRPATRGLVHVRLDAAERCDDGGALLRL